MLKTLHIAPCGIICNICLGFQREKNRCIGCTNTGNKLHHCEVCGFKICQEKNGNSLTFCNECPKFPCHRMKQLDKRYTTKYGESPIENLKTINTIGIQAFSENEVQKWICPQCGKLRCVHRNHCLNCGKENPYFPKE